MPEYMTQYNAARLLEHLNSKGITTDQELVDFIIDQQQGNELPLYLSHLIAVGTFIASLCLIGFLVAVDIISFDHAEGLIIQGLIFIAGAIGLLRIVGHDNTVKYNFFMQSFFAAMAVGKILFVSGIALILDSGWGVALGLFVITAITYPMHRVSTDRFLSSFAALLAILMNILWDQDLSGSREYLLNSFFLLQFLGAAILLTHGKIKRDYVPLSDALIFSLCAHVFFLASYAEFGYWGNTESISPAFINLVLTGGLIALFGWAAGGIEKLKAEPLVLASTGAVFLGLVSAPGILLTIGLMVLGYARHEKPLIIAGALLMLLFLWLYYYNLDISLLQKSGILVTSGVVLLAGRFYLNYKGRDKGEASCVQK